MPSTLPLSDVGHVIQLAIAPVFLALVASLAIFLREIFYAVNSPRAPVA